MNQQILDLEAYKFALDHTVDSVVITDMNSVIEYVNPAFEFTTGFSRQEAIGQKPRILRSRHTSDDTYKQMWSVILSGGWWRGEIINTKKSGEEWYSFLSISQIKNGSGKPFAYVGIARDITSMKKLQFLLKEAGLEAIFMLSVACEAKDETTGNHVLRVERYSQAIARKLGLSEQEAEEIGYSSIMHDVGKIHVPDAVLRKPDLLNKLEWEEMCKHPASGVRILRDKPFYDRAREISENHHEKWNGAGYPAGKKGEEIPLSARIVAVADVFDALTTERPYKPAWLADKAIQEIISKQGIYFDPNVVSVFVDMYRDGTVEEIQRMFP